MRRSFRFISMICTFCFVAILFLCVTDIASLKANATPIGENFDSETAGNTYLPSPQTFGNWTFSTVDGSGVNDSNGAVWIDDQSGMQYITGDNTNVLGCYAGDQALSIKSDAGEFKLNSFLIQNIQSTSTKFKVVGYLSGQEVGSQIIADASSATAVTLSGSYWRNIDEFRIFNIDSLNNITSDLAFAIDDINVSEKETYEISSMSDKTMSELMSNYGAGTQETKTVTITNSGTKNLTSISVAIAGNFNVTQPILTTLNAGQSTTFTIKANDGLTAGNYTGTVTISADNMSPVSFGVVQVVNSSPPSALTGTASSITMNGATLSGTVNANGTSTTVTFEYGITTSYGSTATGSPSTVTGNTATGVSAAISGLTPGITYHYRVKSVNAGGTTYGADDTFTTATAMPSVSNGSPTSLTTSGVTLNGTVNANGASTTVTIEYGITNSYGTSKAVVGSPVTGGNNTAVSAVLTGLSPNTTYHYKIVGVNSNGTTDDVDATFTTLAMAPTASTGTASSIATNGANLSGTVNANGASTDVTFEYGTTTSYGSTATGSPSTVTGNSATAVSGTLSGLTPGATYHYRVKSVNAGGTTYGLDDIFTTATAAPSVSNGSPTSLTTSGVTLNGTVNANGASTTVTIEYGITNSYGTSKAVVGSPVTGGNNTAVSVVLTGLSPNTTYHYKIVGVNSNGTTDDVDATFTTLAMAPTASTGTASSITINGADLSGIVNANGASTDITFEYGTTTSYGSTATGSPSPVTGSTAIGVSATLSGLTPNTTYHYRVKSVNSGGTSYGVDSTFLTGTAAPSVSNGSPTSLTTSGVTLNGTVNANGISTAVTIEYGTTNSYGTSKAVVGSPVTGGNDTAVSAVLTGLSPNTTYHYKIVGVNSNGTTDGGDATFTTQAIAPTAVTGLANPLTLSGVTLNGTVNANWASTDVTFEYGTTSSYGSTANGSPSTVTGNTATAVSVTLSGLTSNTTYHYRVKSVNLGGTTYGSDLTFTTLMEPLVIGSTNPQNETIGQSYSGYSFTSTGGSGSYTYTISAGSLPNGLTLASDGTLSGTPTTIGTSTFEVTVTDSMANSISHTFSITIDPEITYTLTYTAGSNGTTSGAAVQVVDVGDDGTEVTAVPDSGHHFVSWSDGNTNASRTDRNVNNDITVTANFAEDSSSSYTLTYTAGPNGTTSGAAVQVVNVGDDGTEVTAVPDSGYHFVSWSDGITNASRIDRNINADIAVTANFAKDSTETHTLTYTAMLHGTITGSTVQVVNEGENGTIVTAVPNSGYHFVKWSDGLTTASRTETNVIKNINVYARFTADGDERNSGNSNNNSGNSNNDSGNKGDNQGSNPGNNDKSTPASGGWDQNSGKWQFLKDGKPATGWQEVNGSWYLFDSTGSMQVGWKETNGAWYLLNDSGAMAKGWQEVNGSWYFMKDDGAMERGWQQLNGVWYLLKNDGSMAIGWQQLNGQWYYLYTNGSMASNTTVDGYTLGNSGAMI